MVVGDIYGGVNANGLAKFIIGFKIDIFNPTTNIYYFITSICT